MADPIVTQYSIDDLYRRLMTGGSEIGGGDFGGAASGLLSGMTYRANPNYVGPSDNGPGNGEPEFIASYNGDLRGDLVNTFGESGLTQTVSGDTRGSAGQYRTENRATDGSLLSNYTADRRSSNGNFIRTVVPLALGAMVGMAGSELVGAAGSAGSGVGEAAGTVGNTGTYSLGNASLAAPATEAGTYGFGSAALGNTGTVGFGAGGTGSGLSVPAGTWGGVGGASATGAGSYLPASMQGGADYGLSSGTNTSYGSLADVPSNSGLQATTGQGMQLSGTSATGGAFGTGSTGSPGLLQSAIDAYQRIPSGASNLVGNRALTALAGGLLGGVGGGAGDAPAGPVGPGPGGSFSPTASWTPKPVQMPNISLPESGQSNDGLWRYMNQGLLNVPSQAQPMSQPQTGLLDRSMQNSRTPPRIWSI